jgi:hypothetical protein
MIIDKSFGIIMRHIILMPGRQKNVANSDDFALDGCKDWIL